MMSDDEYGDDRSGLHGTEREAHDNEPDEQELTPAQMMATLVNFKAEIMAKITELRYARGPPAARLLPAYKCTF